VSKGFARLVAHSTHTKVTGEVTLLL